MTAILLGRILARLRFLPLRFWERESHGGQIWGIRWLRQHYRVDFGQKFAHKQRCVNKGVIMAQNPIFVLPLIWAFLVDSFAEIAHYLQVMLLIDRSTMKIWYRLLDPFFGMDKNQRRAKTRPSKTALKNELNIQNGRTYPHKWETWVPT